MANTPDTRPSLYQNYLSNRPTDANPEMYQYLTGLAPVISNLPLKGLTEHFQTPQFRGQYGANGPLQIGRQALQELAKQTRANKILLSAVDGTFSRSKAEMTLAGTDEMAAFFAIAHEALFAPADKTASKALPSGTEFWAEIAEQTQEKIGNHPLRDRIREPEAILAIANGDDEERPMSLYEAGMILFEPVSPATYQKNVPQTKEDDQLLKLYDTQALSWVHDRIKEEKFDYDYPPELYRFLQLRINFGRIVTGHNAWGEGFFVEPEVAQAELKKQVTSMRRIPQLTDLLATKRLLISLMSSHNQPDLMQHKGRLANL